MAINSIKKTTVSGVTLATSTNNQVATVTGANALTGESNLTFDGSTLDVIGNSGIGIARTEGTLHVHTATAGAVTASTTADDLVVENSGNAGISILAPMANKSYLMMGAPNDNEGMILWYEHLTGDMAFEVGGGSNSLYHNNGPQWNIADTGNGNQTSGLTINQGANDNEIIAFKSSDVAHGITDYAETDTYGFIGKNILNPAGGGLWLASFSDGTDGGTLQSNQVSNPDSGKLTSSGGAWRIRAALRSGTGITDHGANTNLMTIVNNGTTRFIFDADGDSHQDVGTAWTNFDLYDDAQITRSLGIALSPETAIQTRWDQWGRDHQALIEEVGLMPKLTEEQKARGERGLVNTSLLQRIHNGAIWQLHTVAQDLKESLELTQAEFRAAIDQRDGEIAELRGELMRLQERNN